VLSNFIVITRLYTESQLYLTMLPQQKRIIFMKYIFTIALGILGTGLLNAQTPVKKQKPKSKPRTTTAPVGKQPTELDAITPKTYVQTKADSLKPVVTTTPLKGTAPKKEESPASVFTGRAVTQEDDVATPRKLGSEFDETEIKDAKVKLSTPDQLKPEWVVAESNPFGRMPGERTIEPNNNVVTTPAPAPKQVETPVTVVKPVPKQVEPPVVVIKTTPKQVETPSVTVSDMSTPKEDEKKVVPQVPVNQPVTVPSDAGLDTKGNVTEVKMPVKPEIVSPAVEVQVEEQPAIKGMAMMRFQKKEANFGKMRLGEVREQTFEFKNTGDVPIEIELMDVCPCTALDWDRAPIQPGAVSLIKARFDSQKVYPEGVNHEIEKIITIILKNTDPRNGYPIIEELKLKAFVAYEFRD
jgi:hypothetical protein